VVYKTWILDATTLGLLDMYTVSLMYLMSRVKRNDAEVNGCDPNPYIDGDDRASVQSILPSPTQTCEETPLHSTLLCDFHDFFSRRIYLQMTTIPRLTGDLNISGRDRCYGGRWPGLESFGAINILGSSQRQRSGNHQTFELHASSIRIGPSSLRRCSLDRQTSFLYSIVKT
jgi:hypothetical protein